MKDYWQAISEYRPTYFRVHEIMKGCARFYTPLSQGEAEDAVLFAGSWYDGSGLKREQMETIRAAHLEFRSIQQAHKEVLSCDPTDPEHAFTVATGYDRRGFILSDAFFKQNESPNQTFVQPGDVCG